MAPTIVKFSPAQRAKRPEEQPPLTRNHAYMMYLPAGNLRVTQLVDGNKGIHMLFPKPYSAGRASGSLFLQSNSEDMVSCVMTNQEIH